ncbi:MAG: ATP-binding protein [Blastocatellales bacterium]
MNPQVKKSSRPNGQKASDCLAGGGEMGALMRARDWSNTAVGRVENWPQSLRTAVSICLNSSYPMFVWWGRELTNFYNDAYIPVLGKRHPAALGQPASSVWANIWDVIGPKAEALMNERRATWNEEMLLAVEWEDYTEETCLAFSCSPVMNDDGDMGGLFCACAEDIERRRAEERLRESEERLRALFESSPVPVWEEDFSAVREYFDQLRAQGVSDFQAYFESHPEAVAECAARVRIVDANQTSVRFLQAHDKEKLITELPRHFLPESWTAFRNEMIALAEGQTEFICEVPVQTLSGARKVINLRLVIVPGYEQSWERVLVSFIDVTARRQGEERLRMSEGRLRRIAEATQDALWEIDPKTNHLWWSEGARPLFGHSPGELEVNLEDWYARIHPEDVERVRADFDKFMWSGDLDWLDEYRFRRANGSYIHIIDRGRKFYDESGTLTMIAGAMTDITERKRMEEALKDADRRKDEFLAMLAHELRNPLAPIRNAAQVMKLLDMPEPKAEWAREVIERQTQQLSHLVDDLLDVSRITQGKITLHREQLNLATITSRAVEVSRPLIDARRHILSVSLPPEPLRVEGDLTRLSQIVANLLNNAAKYTEEGGNIWLTVAREQDQVALRVRDTGVGIAPEMLPHVFDLFTQADRSLDRSQGGLGLGLTLVRRLAEMHGGSVAAYSPGLGQGSEFVVRLPLMVAGEKQVDETRATGAAATRGLRILVVDDNVDSADMMAMMLQIKGHETRVTHNGPDAIEASLNFRPDVTLLDIGLPEMDGYEVARRLRQQAETRETALIAVTGYGQAEDRKRSHEAGFNHHLVKPVEPEALEALLGSLRG